MTRAGSGRLWTSDGQAWWPERVDLLREQLAHVRREAELLRAEVRFLDSRLAEAIATQEDDP